jgi:hypothetical protein
MRLLGKTALVLGVAGAIGLAAIAPSEARGGRNAAAIAAGVGGFAVGAAIGSAAAANSYYGPGYGYYGYDSYAYAPTYAPAPAYSEPYVSGSYYGPVGGYGYYGYDSNSTGPWHERTLNGRDW